MAKIQIADVIEPEIFRDSMLEETAEKSRLFQSGIISQNEELDSLASGKGVTVNMPFWQDLATGSEVLSDSSSLTPAKTQQANDKAVRHLRGRAWSANDLAGALTGDDPMQVISSRVASFWARDMQKQVLIPSLTGIFASALSGTHVNDIAIEDGDNAADANLVSKEAILNSVAKLGDSWDSITAIAVHSVVYFRMVSLNLIDFEPLSEQDITVPRFLGREVITDDTLPTEAGTTSGTKYTTYLFGAGAIGFGEGGEPSLSVEEAVETDRDSLAGDDLLIVRRHFLMHPRGVAFVGDPAGVSPTKAELENGANWTKRYEDKNIPVVKLVSNG
jgi:hypothetical protein